MHRSSSTLSVLSKDSTTTPLLKRSFGQQPDDREKKILKTKKTTTCFESIKRKPNRLVVDQPTVNDDNSIVFFHPEKLAELSLVRGDVVLLKGKRHHDTVAVALTDETCELTKVKINKVIRQNLRIRLGDVVSVQTGGMDVPYGNRIHILPLADTGEFVCCLLLRMLPFTVFLTQHIYISGDSFRELV